MVGAGTGMLLKRVPERAVAHVQFAGKRLTVEYHNPQKLDAGKYRIKEILIDGKPSALEQLTQDKVCIPRTSITKDALIKVTLG